MTEIIFHEDGLFGLDFFLSVSEGESQGFPQTNQESCSEPGMPTLPYLLLAPSMSKKSLGENSSPEFQLDDGHRVWHSYH